MLDPLDFENRHYLDRLRRLRLWTKVVVVWENLLSAFWSLASICLFFAALWILEIPGFFGDSGYIFTFVVFGMTVFWSLRSAFQNYKIPSQKTIDARLEEASDLKHAPLKALDDTLANIDNTRSVKLWERRTEFLRHALLHLKLPWPKSILSVQDPYALRVGSILLIMVAFVIAGSSWSGRLLHGLFPFEIVIPGFDSSRIVQITMTPPEYTGFETRTISESLQDAISIPEGSTIKAQVTQGWGTPYVIMDDTKLIMEEYGPNSFGLETYIQDGSHLQIRQFFMTQLDVPYSYKKDLPPTLSIPEDIQTLSKGQLRVPIELFDDYGVRDITLSMKLDPVVIEAPMGSEYSETRAVMTPDNRTIELSPVYDLTFHTWAGLPVQLNFQAIDDKGQVSETQTISLTLPEREFSHPIARQLIAYRKQMIWGPELSHSNIARDLDFVMRAPDAYQNDIIVFLALKTAAQRLRYSPGLETSKALIKLFWETAIRIEDGDVSLALNKMRDIQRQLEQALNDPDVSDEEIAALTQELREAMQEFFTELNREMQKRMAENQFSEEMLNMPGQTISPEDFMRFMDQLESQALNGDTDSARELLSQLDRLMDMMDPNMQMGMPLDMQMMMEGTNEIQELIRKQEELLNQTLDQVENQAENTAPNTAEQEALRFALGELMRNANDILGDIPEGMGLAEQEMRKSSKDLGNNDPIQSVPHQEMAIEYLQQAQESLSQQMMARMQQMMQFSLGQPMQTDPMGRPYGDQQGQSWFPGQRVEIPDETQRKKVDEILRTLREKSGEFNRSEEELEYFRRLLKQF